MLLKFFKLAKPRLLCTSSYPPHRPNPKRQRCPSKPSTPSPPLPTPFSPPLLVPLRAASSNVLNHSVLLLVGGMVTSLLLTAFALLIHQHRLLRLHRAPEGCGRIYAIECPV